MLLIAKVTVSFKEGGHISWVHPGSSGTQDEVKNMKVTRMAVVGLMLLGLAACSGGGTSSMLPATPSSQSVARVKQDVYGGTQGFQPGAFAAMKPAPVSKPVDGGGP